MMFYLPYGSLANLSPSTEILSEVWSPCLALTLYDSATITNNCVLNSGALIVFEEKKWLVAGSLSIGLMETRTDCFNVQSKL